MPGVTFHQSADSCLSPSHEKVAFPMTRYSTSAGRRQIIAGSTICPLPDGARLVFGAPVCPPGTQTFGEFPA